MFRELVQQEVEAGLRGIAHPVQGYVPIGRENIDLVRKKVRVNIPSPLGGTDEGEEPVQLMVDLPKDLFGLIGAQLKLVEGNIRGQNIGVLVGFRGGHTSFPYIIQFLDLQSSPDETHVQGRQPATGARLKTALPLQPPGAAATNPSVIRGETLDDVMRRLKVGTPAPEASRQRVRQQEEEQKRPGTFFDRLWSDLTGKVTRPQ